MQKIFFFISFSSQGQLRRQTFVYREETGRSVKARTSAKLHFVKVSVEKIKYRAQVHQENLKGKFIWWEGAIEKREFSAHTQLRITAFETEGGINFFAMKMFWFLC